MYIAASPMCFIKVYLKWIVQAMKNIGCGCGACVHEASSLGLDFQRVFFLLLLFFLFK